MPIQILAVSIMMSSFIFLGLAIDAIATTNLKRGCWAFLWLCLTVGQITLLTMAGFQPTTYGKPIDGVVVTAVTEDKQITSTAVYDIDGRWFTIPLRGFLPAGVKVTIEKPNHLYYGIYYDGLKERVQIFEVDKEAL